MFYECPILLVVAYCRNRLKGKTSFSPFVATVLETVVAPKTVGRVIYAYILQRNTIHTHSYVSKFADQVWRGKLEIRRQKPMTSKDRGLLQWALQKKGYHGNSYSYIGGTMHESNISSAELSWNGTVISSLHCHHELFSNKWESQWPPWHTSLWVHFLEASAPKKPQMASIALLYWLS